MAEVRAVWQKKVAMRDFSLIASTALALSFGVLASACGGVATSAPATSEAGTSDGGGATTSDGAATVSDSGGATLDAGTFCTGSSPRLMVNGAEVPVMGLAGKYVALNCCQSAEVRFGTSAFQAAIAILWRSAGAPASATIDLADASSPGGIELDLGCDPATGTCGAGAEDLYTTGFQGTVAYATTATGLSTTYCVSVAEPKVRDSA